VVANEADVGVNVIDVAAEAVVANELDIALLAQLLVPMKFPVNDPLNDPVLICVELDTVPVGSVTLIEAVLNVTVAETKLPKFNFPAVP
jgi:hypothetical protein